MPRAQMKQHQYEDLDSALDEIGAGKFHILLLSCICLVWAGDAAEVMVLSYLGPAVSMHTRCCIMQSTEGRGRVLGKRVR